MAQGIAMSLAATQTWNLFAQSNHWVNAVRVKNIVIFFTLLCIAGWLSFGTHKRSELPVYTTAAMRMLSGEAIYRTQSGPAFSYPPCFALLFIPLAKLSTPMASMLWNTLNLCLLWRVLVVLCQIIQPILSQKTHARLAWLCTAVLLNARFLVSPIEYASHDLIILWLLVAALDSQIKQQETWLGFTTGLATACKATPLLFFPMLLLQRRWMATLCFIGTCLLATLLADAIYPAQNKKLWVMQWYETFVSKVQVDAPAHVAGAWRAWNPLNQSLAGTIYRLTTPPPIESSDSVYNVTLLPLSYVQRSWLTKLSLAGLFLTTLWSAFWVYRREQSQAMRHHAQWGLSSVTLSAMLLLSPMSSKQHFCFLVVPVLYVICGYFFSTKRDFILLIGLFFLFVLGTCLAKDFLGKHIGNFTLAYGSLTGCALLCWMLALYRLLGTAPLPITET
jgi:Glycosyltransferase family 87